MDGLMADESTGLTPQSADGAKPEFPSAPSDWKAAAKKVPRQLPGHHGQGGRPDQGERRHGALLTGAPARTEKRIRPLSGAAGQGPMSSCHRRSRSVGYPWRSTHETAYGQ